MDQRRMKMDRRRMKVDRKRMKMGGSSLEGGGGGEVGWGDCSFFTSKTMEEVTLFMFNLLCFLTGSGGGGDVTWREDASLETPTDHVTLCTIAMYLSSCFCCVFFIESWTELTLSD